MRGLLTLLALCGLSVACSSDDGTTSGSEDALGGGGGANGGGATSGSGAGGDAGAASAADASTPKPWPSSDPPATEIVCGGQTCEGSGGLELCCTAADACGAQYLGRAGAGCLVVNDPGLVDPTCPETDEGVGCCRADGFCGAFYSATFGCIDPEAFPSSNVVEKIPCTRTP